MYLCALPGLFEAEGLLHRRTLDDGTVGCPAELSATAQRWQQERSPQSDQTTWLRGSVLISGVN